MKMDDVPHENIQKKTSIWKKVKVRKNHDNFLSVGVQPPKLEPPKKKKIFFLKKKKASKNFPSSSSLSVSGEGFLASRSPIFVPAGKQSAAARSVASQETQKENARIF